MKNVTYINAGAGSGKTHTLTEKLTELIKEHKVHPEQVILTTFTVKAANEFKEKAKAALFKVAVQPQHGGGTAKGRGRVEFKLDVITAEAVRDRKGVF